MPAPMNDADRQSIATIVATLETAWNNADGLAFAAPFASDADFVNVRAELHKGRAAIAEGHTFILRTIYAGSKNQYTIESVRMLHDAIALVHVRAVLDVPGGPLAGHQLALFSMVMRRSTSGWEIASFHNTMQPPAPPRG